MTPSRSPKYLIVFSILIFLFTPSILTAQQENLNVLDRWFEWSDGSNMLVRHLNSQAFAYLDVRDSEVALVGMNNHLKEPASSELVNSELAFPRTVYSFKKAEGNLNIIKETRDINSIIDWSLK